MRTCAYYRYMNVISLNISNIEQRAKALDLTIAALCKKARVSNSTYTRWKAKKTSPNFETFSRLLKILERLERKISNEE